MIEASIPAAFVAQVAQLQRTIASTATEAAENARTQIQAMTPALHFGS